jgi:metal-dependent amidase/aminoacylase/carboxypeptidase family protein
MSAADGLKRRVQESVRRWEPTLLEISHAIHARPELRFEERFAHGLLCDTLAAAGLDAPWFPSIALRRIEATYRGRSAHAAAKPELGRNALDAAVLGYMGVAALRQHIGERERVHGVFTNGGASANVVPERAGTEWFVRAPTTAELDALVPRVLAALESGALATGCEIRHALDPAYAELRTSTPLIERYAQNAAALGRPLVGAEQALTIGVASTDMGNVSQVVPSIHPLVRIAESGVPLHSAAFAACARGAEADRAIVDAATALAMTALDLWEAPETLAAARAELDGAPAAAA